MAQKVLILGNSGTGKSASLRNFDEKEIEVKYNKNNPCHFCSGTGAEGGKVKVNVVEAAGVITGVTVMAQHRNETFAVTSHVKFSDLSEEEIDFYVTNYLPFDKAGAYGIQEWIGYIGVTSLNGSYFNVVGFPVQRIYTELQKFASRNL